MWQHNKTTALQKTEQSIMKRKVINHILCIKKNLNNEAAVHYFQVKRWIPEVYLLATLIQFQQFSNINRVKSPEVPTSDRYLVYIWDTPLDMSPDFSKIEANFTAMLGSSYWLIYSSSSDIYRNTEIWSLQRPWGLTLNWNNYIKIINRIITDFLLCN